MSGKWETNEALSFPFEELTDQEEHEHEHTQDDAISVLLDLRYVQDAFGCQQTGCPRLPKASWESNRKQGEERK